MIPSGLSARSRRLWRQVLAEFELAPGEIMIFEELLHTSDELARLENLAAELGELTVETTTGVVRTHPVFDQLLRHRATQAKLAEQLNLPHLAGENWAKKGQSGAENATKPASLASVRARKAAQVRWSNRAAPPTG